MISVILPTYNEAANLPELLNGIATVLKGQTFEVIVVDDDSPDKTWQEAQKLQRNYPMLEVIRRVGRRGLSSAVVEGFAAAKGEMLVVMDADLQHDPAVIARLAEKIRSGADIAVASRYTEGGSVGSWITGRRVLSNVATSLARALPRVRVSDPMSGFFAVRREVYEKIAGMLRPSGFKILFEILSFLPRSTRVAEVPLEFQMRKHGESKLSLGVEMIYLWQLLRVACIRLQGPLFAVVCVAAFATLLPHALALLPLYADASVRARVSATLSQAADDQGWLLSDMQLTRVTSDGIRILHRRHHRGTDERACLVIRHEDRRVSPCAD